MCVNCMCFKVREEKDRQPADRLSGTDAKMISFSHHMGENGTSKVIERRLCIEEKSSTERQKQDVLFLRLKI